MVVFQLEGVEGAASLPLVLCRQRLLILPRVRAVMGEVTGSAAVIADDFAVWSLRVTTSGAWLYGSKVGGMLACSILSPWASLPV